MYGKVIIVGDVHGDMNQFLYPLLYFCKYYDECEKIIYLGDYIDRGESNVYIYEIIKALNRKKKFIFLRGNHECYDSGTKNHINMLVNNNPNSYLKTFIFNLFLEMDLDLVHYDDYHNILFSHSPLARDLNDCLEINKLKDDVDRRYDYTFTEDVPYYGMGYRNIHGHTHIASDTEDILSFFNSDFGMIGIDNDASYGCKYTVNIMNYYIAVGPRQFDALKVLDAQFTNCFSNVLYFVLEPNGECMKMTKNIKFGSPEDYNQFMFNDIIMLLRSVTTDDYLMSLINSINLSTSSHWLKQCFNNAHVPHGKELEYVKQLRTVDSNLLCYFHDVPYELYKNIGVVVPCIPVHMLYYRWL